MNDARKAALRELARRELASRQQQAPERGLGARLYDNIIGNPDDGVTSTGEAIGTWLNRAGESATLGVAGDEASAAMTGMLPGRSYESELDRYRQNEDDMSTAGRLSADVSGAFVPGAGLVGAVARGGSGLARAGRGAVAGATAAGINGFAEGEGGPVNRIQDAGASAAVGAGLGAGATALGSLMQGAIRSRAEKAAVNSAAKAGPTTDALRAEGNELYRQVDQAGVQILPEAFGRMREETLEALRNNTGYDELPGPGSLSPNASRVMEIMSQADNTMQATPTAALPFKSLDQMRRQAGAAAGNVANKVDKKAGVQIIEQLDDFVQRLGPDDIAGGNVEALQTAIPKAREVWSRMTKSQLIDDAMERSENYLSGSASGVRNQFKAILNNKRLSAQFTDAEKRALRMVTHGSALDQLINTAGHGLAQMGSIGAGFATGGPVGAILGAGAATGQRKLAEAVTMRNAEKARAAIASGRLNQPIEPSQASTALAQLMQMQMLGQSGNLGAATGQMLLGR